MIQTNGILWMDCGLADHLYRSYFNDSRVNFLLKKKCTLRRVRIAAAIHSNFNKATPSARVPSKCLKFQDWTKIENKNITLKNGKDVKCPWTDLQDVSGLKIIDNDS